MTDTNPELLTIGTLSRRSGVPVETLRTWERRYGFPDPQRRASGHRRYLPETADRVRLVRRALEVGCPAREAVAASPAELRQLLLTRVPQGLGAAGPVGWLEHVQRFDAAALLAGFERAWTERGARAFTLDAAVPFLQEVGLRWERGELTVGHEHFASERLRDFLARQWRPLGDGGPGPGVVCATLPGEQHALPLHLAAVLLVNRGFRVVLLGPDTPCDDIVAAARSFGAAAVLVGTSASAEPIGVRAGLERLVHGLPVSTAVAVGGPLDLPLEGRVRALATLDALDTWPVDHQGIDMQQTPGTKQAPPTNQGPGSERTR